MAEYIKQEMANMNSEQEHKSYYRLKSAGNIGMQELVKEMAGAGSGLSEGSVMHVLTSLAERMAYYMAKGYSVTLADIGTFKAGLGVVEHQEMDGLEEGTPQRNARSIEVNQVLFRPDKTLIRTTNRQCKLKRGGVNRLKKSPYSKEERLQLALDYLHDHPFMRVADYMEITQLSRTAATLELQEWRSRPDSGIDYRGRGSSLIYVSAEKNSKKNA